MSDDRLDAETATKIFGEVVRLHMRTAFHSRSGSQRCATNADRINALGATSHAEATGQMRACLGMLGLLMNF